MAPKAQPRVPNAKVKIEDFVTKDGKIDSAKLGKLTDVQIKNIVDEAVQDLRAYIAKGFFDRPEKAPSSIRLLEALDKEYPDLGLDHYVLLARNMEKVDGKGFNKEYFDSLKQYDPDTFNLYLKYAGGEAYIEPKDFDFGAYVKAENMSKGTEPSTGVLTDEPLNNASPAETPSGALTNPPKLPESSNLANIDNNAKGLPVPKAESATEPKEGIVMEDIPIVPEAENPAVASPSPEAIGEAMRDAVLSKDGTVTVPPESVAKAEAEIAAKETGAKTPAAEEASKTEAKTETATDKTDSKTPETPETPQGLFSRLGGHIGRNWGKYLLGGGLGTVGWGIINDLASENSKLRSSFTEGDYTLDANQPHVKSLDQREGAYMPERLLRFTTNEEYTPGKIPSHIPQDNLPSVKESTTSKKVKSQPQVVNAPAPVNNATADYVRAAYNSYIPSDAGRAYQKAIYGDPLELDRMRLQQQQQQKWRDFVMRSGQSPAELVQRGLMPYDALQYI